METILRTPESYMKVEDVGYLKSKLQLLNGKLYLSKDRLVLISNKTTIGSGLIGRLIKKKVESKKYGFDLNLSKIKSISQGKLGLQKNVLEIATKSGINYRVLVKDYGNWASAINGNII